jgi:hypothetical protein
MSDTLAQLIDKLQATLSDDGTLFTDAMCTAAFRLALSSLNLAAPIAGADTLDVVAEQKEYEIDNDDAATIIQITDVLLEGTDSLAENHTPLKFQGYFEDNRPFFRLDAPQASGTLIARYSLPHTVDDLDSAAASTLQPRGETVLLNGAAYFACLSRAAARVEAINLNKEVPDPWQDIANHYKRAFELGLRIMARQAQPNFPRTDAWNDDWHSWM